MKPLSNQAKWYLGGNYPVYLQPAVGHAKPEPKAMQELVDNGLAFFTKHPLLGDFWLLTQAGEQARHEMKTR